MSKFLIRLLSFLIFVSILLSPFCLFTLGGEKLKYIDNPVAALIDKQSRLDTLSGRRVIIVGGSNAFYGMDSKLISDQLHVEVVNMGLFAGFGLDFMLNQLKGHLRKDDIVLFSIEYLLKLKPSPKAKESIVKYFPLGPKILNEQTKIGDALVNKIKLNVESLQNIALKPFKSKSTTFIQTREMNIYGDAIGYLNFKKPDHPDFNSKIEYSKWEGINEIYEFVLNSGLSVDHFYFVYPPIPNTYFQTNKEVISKIEQDLTQNKFIKILCKPSDMVYPDSLFFDTNYHLHVEGRQVRSNKIAEFLKQNIVAGNY